MEQGEEKKERVEKEREREATAPSLNSHQIAVSLSHSPSLIRGNVRIGKGWKGRGGTVSPISTEIITIHSLRKLNCHWFCVAWVGAAGSGWQMTSSVAF